MPARKEKEPAQVKRFYMMDVVHNIDAIAKQIENGALADREIMTKMINRMLAFIDSMVKNTEQESACVSCAHANFELLCGKQMAIHNKTCEGYEKKEKTKSE